MTTFYGALMTEHGVTFGIIVVQPHVLGIPDDESRVRAFGQRVFGEIPLVLMGRGAPGRPRFSGRPDLVQWLTQIPPTAIPLVEWSVPDA